MISCLCPTFNRYPTLRWLLEEAVECFFEQDHPDKELLILNDTPGQTLSIGDSRAAGRVRIFNSRIRLPDLSAKIQYLIDRAAGDVFCRWDDDDLSLPWRLSYSLARLGDRIEWRPENFWFANGASSSTSTSLPWQEDHYPGNSHVMAIWRREALAAIGGRYPAGFSGGEDLTFNRLLAEAGHPRRGDIVPTREMFYVYRWGTGSRHLSGVSDGSPRPHQAHWDALGRMPIEQGTFMIRPRFRNHVLVEYDNASLRSAHFQAGAL